MLLVLVPFLFLQARAQPVFAPGVSEGCASTLTRDLSCASWQEEEEDCMHFIEGGYVEEDTGEFKKVNFMRLKELGARCAVGLKTVGGSWASPVEYGGGEEYTRPPMNATHECLERPGQFPFHMPSPRNISLAIYVDESVYFQWGGTYETLREVAKLVTFARLVLFRYFSLVPVVTDLQILDPVDYSDTGWGVSCGNQDDPIEMLQDFQYFYSPDRNPHAPRYADARILITDCWNPPGFVSVAYIGDEQPDDNRKFGIVSLLPEGFTWVNFLHVLLHILGTRDSPHSSGLLIGVTPTAQDMVDVCVGTTIVTS